MKKRLVVLSGAGVSAESGLATFRDNDGLWMNHSVEDVASIDGFRRNPQLVLDFYAMRRREAASAQPNDAHRAIASLEEEYDVYVITQNVDDLHERAGSTQIIHLHGELNKNCSTKDRHTTLPVTEATSAIKVGDLAPDGGQLRPFIVWFGEDVPMMIPAIEIAERADIFVVIGTSLNVYPAAGLLAYVPPSTPIYLIDPQPVSSAYRHDIHHIAQPASLGIAQLIDLLADTRCSDGHPRGTEGSTSQP